MDFVLLAMARCGAALIGYEWIFRWVESPGYHAVHVLIRMACVAKIAVLNFEMML